MISGTLNFPIKSLLLGVFIIQFASIMRVDFMRLHRRSKHFLSLTVIPPRS